MLLFLLIPTVSEIGCKFLGLGNVGCSTSFCNTWIAHDYVNDIAAYTHELGHNLGLAHSGDIAGITANDLEYGDFSCSMGLV